MGSMVEIGMPEAVDVFSLIAAHLPLLEAPFGLPGTGSIALRRTLAKVSPGLEVAAEGAIRGHRPQRLVLLGQGHQIVVVQLDRPTRILPVLGFDRLNERGGQSAGPAGIPSPLGAQNRDGVFRLAGGIVPAFQGGHAEADRRPMNRVLPGAPGQVMQGLASLTVGRGSGQQGADDGKAQPRPAIGILCFGHPFSPDCDESQESTKSPKNDAITSSAGLRPPANNPDRTRWSRATKTRAKGTDAPPDHPP